MKSIKQSFNVPFTYQTYFTEGVFDTNNPLLCDALTQHHPHERVKCIFVVDDGVEKCHPNLKEDIHTYMAHYSDQLDLRTEPIVMQGGEGAKNNDYYVQHILQAVNDEGICRHSFIIAIGGGAILDMVGFAASVAHRGVRHVRIPTTVLSQNDSGVGVKNGINFFGKKNFLGSFKPPQAVINDANFLETLDMRDWRSGISEAIKVALIKDLAFFKEIQANAQLLVDRDKAAMQDLIFRCAELHIDHIAGGDPFEMGSSRPLDFGHWAAHKLEQLTKYSLRHGEAVAIGIALDVTYAYLKGMIDDKAWQEVLELIENLGFSLCAPELSEHLYEPAHPRSIIKGLEEFREHLGGQLTIMLIDAIGHGVEVNEMEPALIQESVELLKEKEAERVLY